MFKQFISWLLYATARAVLFLVEAVFYLTIFFGGLICFLGLVGLNNCRLGTISPELNLPLSILCILTGALLVYIPFQLAEVL